MHFIWYASDIPRGAPLPPPSFCMSSNSAIRLEWNTDSVMAEWYRANGILRAQRNADSAMAEQYGWS
jgi:hypothetical protein